MDQFRCELYNTNLLFSCDTCTMVFTLSSVSWRFLLQVTCVKRVLGRLNLLQLTKPSFVFISGVAQKMTGMLNPQRKHTVYTWVCLKTPKCRGIHKFLPLGLDSCVSSGPGGLCSWNVDMSKWQTDGGQKGSKIKI